MRPRHSEPADPFAPNAPVVGLAPHMHLRSREWRGGRSIDDEEVEMRARIDPDGCLGCGVCVDCCPEEAISMTAVDRPIAVVDPAR